MNFTTFLLPHLLYKLLNLRRTALIYQISVVRLTVSDFVVYGGEHQFLYLFGVVRLSQRPT